MQFKNQTLEQFALDTSSNSPVPGGGSVSALCASLSVALAQMVARLTIGKKNYEAVSDKMSAIVVTMSELQSDFLEAIDKDANSFDAVMKAFKLPKESQEEKDYRRSEIIKATKYAAEIPLSLAEKCSTVFDDFNFVAENGNKNALSDIAVAAMLIRTAILGALYNVKINLNSLPDDEYKEKMKLKVSALEEMAEGKEKEILSKITL